MPDQSFTLLLLIIGSFVIPTLIMMFGRFLDRKKGQTDLAQNAYDMADKSMKRLDEEIEKRMILEETVEKMKAQKTAPIHVDVYVRRDGPELHASATAEYVIESEM